MNRDKKSDAYIASDVEQIATLLASIPSDSKRNVLAMVGAFIAGMEAQRSIKIKGKSA